MHILRAIGMAPRLLIAVLTLAWMSTWFLGMVEAQSTYSNNPNDYDFMWIPTGVFPSGSVPSCSHCINAFDNTNGFPDDRYYNRSIGVYRCDGVQPQELWAYDNRTNVIISFNVTPQVLCIDSEFYELFGALKLLPCNSSKPSQKWVQFGNKIVNGLVNTDSSLFFVGIYLDKTTNPTATNYSTPLFLGSSANPLLPPAGFFQTDEFTMLATSNIIVRSTDRFNTAGLLKVSNSSLERIVNGGFEESTVNSGTALEPTNYHQTYPSYFSLCGWVSDFGPIDYVKSGFLPAKEGAYSIHLNTYSDTNHYGQISQTIAIKAGREYNLSFYMTAFPSGLPQRNCSSTYTEALMQVTVTNAVPTDIVGGYSSPPFVNSSAFQRNFSVAKSSTVNIVWILRTVRFRAMASANLTTISFTSLNFNNSCGPMLDAVSVSRIVKGKNNLKIILPIVLSVGVIGGIIVGILALVYGRKYYREREEYSGLYKTENARVYSSKELRSSTKNFSSVLGEGGFGTVYKADFRDGTVGAVKVEKPKGLSSTKKVLAQDEIAVLLRVHHRNLVNLMGFCIHKGRHMLVFEYLPNGSLHDRLHQSILDVPLGGSFHLPPGKRESMDLSHSQVIRSFQPLSWQKRVKIACDVAFGLEYLHHDADPPIVHRDVKSQNILLTANDSAKLADFGLSKAAPADATSFQSIETMVRGSIGYLDPQYFTTGLFSAKSDVYSYGVVLLELISGHQAIFNAASIASWAAPFLTDPSLYPELIDKNLNGEFDRGQLDSLLELTNMCMQEDGKQRPSMRQVVAFLSSKQLVVANSDSTERADLMTRGEYHKMHPMFIDLNDVDEHNELSTISRENIAQSMQNLIPIPRD